MIIPEVLWRDSDYTGCDWRHSGDPDDYSTLQWKDSNTVTKPTEAQLQAKWDGGIKVAYMKDTVREKRDELIKETDWWGTSDITMTSEQTTYRQSLRDITNDTTGWDTNEYGAVTGVTWPTKP